MRLYGYPKGFLLTQAAFGERFAREINTWVFRIHQPNGTHHKRSLPSEIDDSEAELGELIAVAPPLSFRQGVALGAPFGRGQFGFAKSPDQLVPDWLLRDFADFLRYRTKQVEKRRRVDVEDLYLAVRTSGVGLKHSAAEREL